MKQINGDEYIETSKLDMSNKEVKQSLQKESLESIKGVLDKQYIEEIGINDKNIISMHEKYRQKGDYSQNIIYKIEYIKILTKPLTENMFLSMVNAKINNEDFNILLKVDGTNLVYSVFLEDYLTKNNYNENMKKEDINITEESITSTGYNQYIKVEISDNYIVSQYFSEYKMKMINDKQSAYELLDEDYSKRKYQKYQNFEKYIDTNQELIKYASIESYQVNKFKNQTEYVCLDNNGNYYIFLTNSVMDYKVVLDTYTIDIPSFTKKYNESNNETKVGMNLEKIFAAINDKEYKYVYNKLDDTFKTNNFKTEIEFEKYVKENFYNKNVVKYNSYEVNGDLYIYDITITDATGKKENSVKKTFVMQLKEGTDFVMSFSVN